MKKEVTIMNQQIAPRHAAHSIIEMLNDLSKKINISLEGTESSDAIKFFQTEIKEIINQITANWQFENRLIDSDWAVIIERATGNLFLTKRPDLIDADLFLIVSKSNEFYYDHQNPSPKEKFRNLPEIIFHTYQQSYRKKKVG